MLKTIPEVILELFTGHKVVFGDLLRTLAVDVVLLHSHV